MAEKKKKRSLADELRDYADGSAAGLQRMVRDVREARGKVPAQVDHYAGLAAELLPGYAAYESLRNGRESARAFNEGDYATALIEHGNGVSRASDALMWFMPGMGLIRMPK